MPNSQLYMLIRKVVPKLVRRRTVASTWHDIIRGIFTLRYRWPETSCNMKIWRLCPLTKLYMMSKCNEWSAGSPTRRTVDMTQPSCCDKYRKELRCRTWWSHRCAPTMNARTRPQWTDVCNFGGYVFPHPQTFFCLSIYLSTYPFI